ncbi:MBG domain-containing protein [Pseudoramibacter porci]|uniref:Ig-like domain-containing protein n=1 Tax=Pseudoramibacter porci TaxID=2606631 RepID=A0A7X2T9M7_9FIRM|nr:MBG domain-containing protein [Pseudoramibacter porci]MSS19210.1 hypothetical protein [Pseudoramibacter porci]
MKRKIFTWLFAAMFVAGAIFFIKPQAVFAAEGDDSASSAPTAAVTQTTTTPAAVTQTSSTPSTATRQTPAAQTASAQTAETVTTAQSSDAAATTEKTAEPSASTTTESTSEQTDSASNDASTQANTQQNAAVEDNTAQSGGTQSSTQTAATTNADGQSAAVEKGTIAAPTDLKWNGSQMIWTAPGITTTGGTVDSGAVTGYTLYVYKGKTLVFTTSTDATHYDNFANNIIGDDDKGSGRYTFTVQALTAKDNAYYNQEGAVSTESGAYVVPLVTVTGDNGIASTTPGDSFLLLPGNADHSHATVTATVQDGYQFAGWTGTGVTFDDASKSSTTVTINAGYDGDTALTITATSRDSAPPVISSFTGQDHSALTATATDGQTGIVRYAFTTKSNQNDLTDSDWTAVENSAARTKTFIYNLSAGGTYYFYAQDGSGNIAKSDALDVTKITYKNYTKPNDAADRIEYLIGSETYILSEPAYHAYDFNGWYLNSDFSGDTQTKITAHQDQGYILYGKWTAKTISKSELQLSNITKVYDGQSSSLAVNPTNTGNLSYQWFKGDKAIENATSKTLSVENVADSGTYHVAVTLKDDEGNVVATATSDPVTVTISKRPVIVEAQNQTLTYGAERVSSYLYIYEKVPGDDNSGLITGDENQITVGTLSCEYQKGNAAGRYDIAVRGFTSANYDIKMTPGTLTVNPKSADAVTAALEKDAYVYIGSEIKPAVTVTDGSTTLKAGTDYTVEYTNNIDVGKATATVKFQGNYTGTKTLLFNITKADFDSKVSINGWTYGNTASTPTVDANPGGGTVTYYYAKADSKNYTTAQPSQAGDYQVYAVIAATDNYNSVTTAAQKFTIAKRTITIKAADATFEYDGAAHSANAWSYINGTFASGEGFFAVTVKGTATDVTGNAGVANVITYTLTSATDADNYAIDAQNGKIVITPANLTVPAQPVWSAEAPGSAAWIAVAKKDLTVAYKLTLYAFDGTTYTPIGDPVMVSGTSYDFSRAIREYAAAAAKEGKAYRYAFTILSISSGGMNRDNYANSPVSEKFGNLLTAAVTLTPNEHLSSLTIGGQNAGTYILLQGERAAIGAKANEGWKFSDSAFTADSGLSLSEGAVTDTLIHDNFAAVHSTSAVITMRADAATSAIGQTVRVNTEDDVPWITTFTADNTADLKNVTFRFNMGDANGLAAWALTTSKDAPEKDADVWQNLSGTPTTYEGSTSASAAGKYYLYAKDTSGHIVTASTVVMNGAVPTYTKKGINVYALTLKSGTGADHTLYKIENTTVTLPALTTLGFAKTGYAFQNWYGATGIYQDQGGYAANANDTLTAHWTNEHFDVQVKYFYMGTDGNYSATPSATVSYNVLYGTKLNTTDDQVKRDQVGFTRDDVRSSSVTVTSAGQYLNVYYKRNQYTITKTYTAPGETKATNESQIFYYGADVSGFLKSKPSSAGYTFVGWTFEGSGGQPATMPAYDVSASGTFEAQPATYHIVSYTQDLKADGTPAETYTENSSRDVMTVNGAAITFGKADAAAIEGFTYAGAAVTTGSGSATKPADVSEEVTAAAKTANSETDQSNEVYINVYYMRNAYTLTQNVWKGEVGGHPLRAKTWTLYYGAPITAATYADDDLASIAPSGYTLASYVGWSTNTPPTAMPAGNVTCTRQYVSNVEGQYQVEVYIEGDTANTYTKQTYNYTGNVGATVTIGEGDTDTINYTNLSSSIPYFKYLQYKTVTDQDIADGKVQGASGVTVLPTVTRAAVTNTNDGETPVVLRIYFERQPITATIHYYYNVDGNNIEVATVTKTQKWGANSSFDYEALALFDTVSGGKWKGSIDSDLNIIAQVDGSNPDVYDFRNNGYVVSYTASYDLNDTHYYNSYRYDSEASLTGDDIGAEKRIMGYANNIVDVYYTKPDPTKQFYLDVVYNSGAYPGLAHGENKDVPVTYTYNGKTYQLRYQNEAAFYKDTKYAPDTAHTNYPGLNNLNLNNGDSSATTGKYIYSTSNVKDGYTRIEIGGTTYFISGDYLYIPLTANNYFLNNLTSVVIGKSDSDYTVNADELAHTDITNFLTTYRNTYASEAQAKGAHVYYHAWGSDIVKGNDVLLVTFEDARIVHLHYIVNGTSSYQQEYAQGGTVTDFSGGKQNYPEKAGYDLVWYTDPACTVKATSLTMDTDRNVYGQYEKNDLYNTVYAYYELANDVTKNGTTYHYITEKDLDAFKDDAALASSTENGVTTWTYNGQVVMVQKTQTSLSFATVSMKADDYQKDDFTFDDANADNRLTGYAESSPVTLRAYFKRNQYEVTVDENKEHANAVTDKHRVGETIQLSTPSRNGYTFTGWKLTQVTGSGDAEWQTLTDKTSFTMPNTHIKAVAQWSPAAFTQNIVHYYQNPVTLTYNQAEVAAMMAATTSTDVTIHYNGTAYTGKLYANGGVTFEIGGTTYYIATPTKSSETSYSASPKDLSAIAVPVSVTQDTAVKVSDNKNDVDHYNFASAVYQYEDTLTQLGAKDQYTNKYGMSLSYFYTLQTGLKVVLQVIDDQGTDNPTCTLTGAGQNDHYGQSVSISAVPGAGYTFVGWYKASDVLGSDGKLIQDYKKKTAVSKDPSFTQTLEGDCDYVAVVSALDVAQPTLTVGGTTELTYGYEAGQDNAVSVQAAFADGTNTDDVNYIASYQWYREMNGKRVAINGATAATYLIPEGLDAGTYIYTCDITVARRDNGRIQTYTSSAHTLTINPADMSVTVNAENPVITYDGQAHSSGVSVNKPADDKLYTVYYSNEEITADNLADLIARGAATTTAPEYTNVKVETDANGKVSIGGAYTTYYYVKYIGAGDANHNYQDASGSTTLTIVPKHVTLKAGSVVYHKTYDGETTVSGTATDSNSDLGKLVHGKDIYTIVGMANTDTDKGYVIDCSADFNSIHQSEANAITISRMKVINGDNQGTTNYNYVFADDYTITISGYIDRLPLTLQWGGTEFTYDGQSHQPTAQISSTIPAHDSDHLSVTVSGAQINRGTYNASATVSSTDAETYITDFSLSNGGQNFTIARRAITVKMDDGSATYDGNPHGPTTYTITEGTLPTDYVVTAESSKQYTNAGTYTDIKPTNVRIHNTQGEDVTDNFAVTSGNGSFTIQPKSVKVSGITASDKNYDGNTKADLDISQAIFDGIVEGDQLSLDPKKVTGAFENANAGNDKKVDLNIDSHALTGASAANYVLATDNQSTTTATINKLVITVTPDDQTIIYGETPGFSVAYSGFLDGETDNVISYKDQIIYTVGKNTASADDYASTLSVGNYTIFVNTNGLSADNYTFTPGTGTLTIDRRPIAVTAADGANVTKTYDGTTTADVQNSDYAFTAVAGNSASGIVNNDNVTLRYSAAYDSKDVGTPAVHMTGLSIDNGNYILATNAFDIAGTIKPRTLTVTADNKTITYGENAPAYTATYAGFVHDETASALGGTLAFTCDYDTNVATKRNAGTYTITPSGLTSGNYTISFISGILTVNKKEITITANNLTGIYGNPYAPNFGYTYSGLVYDENYVDVVNGTVLYTTNNFETTDVTVNGKTTKVISSTAGVYTITPNVSGLSAQNYSFVAANGTFTINKYGLNISGIVVKDKVYDGTTNVDGSQFDYKNVKYDGLLAIDQAYIDAHHDDAITAGGVYADSANVDKNKTVNLKITLLEYLSQRCYVLQDDKSQKTATSSITKRPVLITADSKTIQYGEDAPQLTVTYSQTKDANGKVVAASGLVAGETAGKANVTLSTTYVKYDDVRSYRITVDGFTKTTGSADPHNYVPNYTQGTLTVKSNQLTAPQPTWDATVPDKVTWNAVSGIGKVDVQGYTLTLYRNGEAVVGSTRTVAAAGSLEMNYSDLIHKTGAGTYTIKIKANASTENNADQKNVTDSDEGESGELYAANVTFQFASDAITQAGKGDTISIGGQPTYTMLAGETGVAINAALKNATGYTVQSVTSDKSVVTIADSTDTARTDASYASTVSMDAGLKTAGPVTVSIALSARPATLSVTVTPRPGTGQAKATYGYSETDAPSFTATVNVDSSGDNIGTGDYTYTYRWDYRIGAKDVHEGTAFTSSNTWKLPTGLAANASRTYYTVRCIVTAKRNDNGQTTTTVESWDAVSYVTNVTITARSITNTDFTISKIDNVIYNGSAHTPEPAVTDTGRNVALVEGTDFTYSYSNNVDAGTATVIITGKGNYADKITRTFTINPRHVSFSGNSHEITYDGTNHSYSDITEGGQNYEAKDANSGLVSGHTSNVEYHVTGTEAGNHSGSITPSADIVIRDANKVDVTKNYVVESRAGSLIINQSLADWKIFLTDNTYIYDGTAHHMINAPTTDPNANGAKTGTTTYTYSTELNGNYVSDLTSLTRTNAGSTTIYVKATNPNYSKTATTQADLIIDKRAISFDGHSIDENVTYDGAEHGTTAFTIGGKDYAAKDDTNGLAAGHKSNVTYSLKGTDVGDYTGKITSGNIVITDAKGQNVTDNYAIQLRLGTMKIVETNAAWTIALDNDTVTYDGTAHYNTKAVASQALSGETRYEYSLDGVTYYDDLTSLTKVNAGTYTIDVKATNPNYSKPATTTATLTINPKPVTITWTGDAFVYDGTTKLVTAEVSNKAKDDDTFTLGYGGTREASAVGSYSAKVTSLGNDNYTLDGATGIDHNWSIGYLATDASATVSGTMGKNDWYVGRDTKLNAPAGYQISRGESDWTSSICYPKDGQYTDVQYKLKNIQTGQITDFKTVSFKVDQSQPTGTIRDGSKDITDIDSKIAYHYIYPDQVTLTIVANDQENLSGVDTIAYQVVTKGQTFDPNGTWQTYTNAFNIAANTEAVVYAKITDKAGNVSIIHTDGLVVYTNATDKDNINYTLTTGQDQISGIALNGNTVKTVKLGDTTLTEGEDYRVENHKLIIDGDYLETLSAGDHNLIVSWNPLGETGETNGTLPNNSTITVHVLKHEGQVTDIQNLTKTYDGSAVGHPTYTSKSTGNATYLYKKAADPDDAYSITSPTDAGDYIVKVIVGTDSKYEETSGTQTFTINRRKVTFTGVSDTITYDGKTHTYTQVNANDGGLVSGHQYRVDYKLEGKNVGTYTGDIADKTKVTILSGSDDVTQNYDITTTNGQLIIKKSDDAWTISLGDSTHTYDGQPHAMNTTPSVSDLNGTTTYWYSFDEGEGYVNDLSDLTKDEAGDYIIYVKADNTNYNTTAKTKAHLIINPSDANWTIALDNDTVTYDGTAHYNTKAAASQALSGETRYEYSFDGVTYYDDLTSLTKVNAGTYTIDVKATNPNYSKTATTQADLIIDKRPVTFTGVSDTVTYDGQNHAYTQVNANDGGLVSGHQYTVGYTLEGKNAGTYIGGIADKTQVTIRSGSDDVTANYDITTTPGTLTINKTDAQWRVDLPDDTVTYDGTAHHNTKTAKINSLDGTTVQYSFNKDSGYVDDLCDLTQTDAGTYTIYVKATNPNYTTSEKTTTAALTINKRPITFTGESAEITYDGNPHTYTKVTIGSDGLASGHTSNLTYSLAGKDAGHYSGTLTQDIHITDGDNNDVTKNYDITAHNGTLIIAARPIADYPDFTVGEIAEVTYDGSAHTPEPAVTDTGRADRNHVVLVKDTDLTYHYSNNVDAGTATVTITGRGNYTGTIDRTFTINKRPVSFTGKSYTLTYDGKAHRYDGITVDGLLDGQTSDVRYSVSGTNAGTYGGAITKAEDIKITDGNKDVTANYAVTSAAGKLTIDKKDIAKADVTLGELVKFNNQALTQKIRSVVVDGLTVTYTVVGDTASQPGVYTLTLTGTGNFTGTCTKPWVLTADQNGQTGDVEGNVNVDVHLKNEAPKTDLITSKASVIQITADANEMSAVADGAVLDIWLENTDISDTISRTSKDAFEKKAPDLIVGAYVDISLYKQLFVKDQAQAKTQLHNVARPIRITMKLPKRLINNDANYRRSYKLFRLHDGVVEMIPVDYNAQDQTLTFSSDKFSEYAIVYADAYIGKSAADKDNRNHAARMICRTASARGHRQQNLSVGSAAQVQAAGAQSNGAAYRSGSPKTGDDQTIALWLILMLVSCFGMGAVMKSRGKNG